MDLSTNYLAAEAPTLERLKEQVDLVPDNHCLVAADIGDIKEDQQVTPSLHLLYGGDRMVGQSDRYEEDGADQLVEQFWIVVVVVKHAGDKSKARQQAGPIITQAINALTDWNPIDGCAPFVRVNGPNPWHRKGGFAYFPLRFQTTLLTGV